MKGILADVHMAGYVEALAREMQNEYWHEIWLATGLRIVHFHEVGLTETSTDVEIWKTCQAEELILLTNNRNEDSADSLNSAIRNRGTPASLPVFTIGDLDRLRYSREYAESAVEKLFDYVLRIEELLGTGRLFIP